MKNKPAIYKLLTEPRLKAVSFDLFDTLIQRVSAKAEDVFALMEPKVSRLTGRRFGNYQEVRPQAAWLAKLKRSRPREESTLAEIYQQMVEMNLLTEAQAGIVSGWEIEAEKRLLIRREQGLRIFAAARAAGLRILISTDTYLPRPVLEEILSGLGIEGYQAIYASSQYRRQKYYGGLFELLLEREGLKADEIAHIGDNPHSDAQIPARLGWASVQLPKAADNFKRHPGNMAAYVKGFPDSSVPVSSLYASMCMGLAASRLYADTENPVAPQAQWGGLFEIGYGALGPAVSAFAIWLAKAAREAGVETLFFLSRDGWLPKQIFGLLAPELCPEMESRYLYNSRRAVLSAGLRRDSDIIGICCSYFQPAPVSSWLADKFRLTAEELPTDILAKYDLSPETVIDMSRRKTLIPLCLDLSPAIYERASECRRGLTAYLNESGCWGGSKQAVVDIGFSGAIQSVLADMVKDPGLGGFYFFSDVRMSRPVLNGLRAQSFFQGFIDKFSDQFAHKYVYHYFESFFKKPGESGLEGFELNHDGSARPVFKTLDGPGNSLAAEIQAGAEAFARDLAGHFGPWLPDIIINPHSACQPYLNFFLRPAPQDARLLEGFMVDDTFCGSQGSYFISPAEGPRKLEESYWREGAEAILSLAKAT